ALLSGDEWGPVPRSTASCAAGPALVRLVPPFAGEQIAASVAGIAHRLALRLRGLGHRDWIGVEDVLEGTRAGTAQLPDAGVGAQQEGRATRVRRRAGGGCIGLARRPQGANAHRQAPLAAAEVVHAVDRAQ